MATLPTRRSGRSLSFDHPSLDTKSRFRRIKFGSMESELEHFDHFLKRATLPQVKSHVPRWSRYDEQVFVMSSTSPGGACDHSSKAPTSLRRRNEAPNGRDERIARGRPRGVNG